MKQAMRWSMCCWNTRNPLHKVTIIPRGPSLGSTMSLPKEDILNYRKKELLDSITMTMARSDCRRDYFRRHFDRCRR
ncbi:MAG: hypothetical protein WDM80_09690 [Limisphaerales bacterium]